MSNNLPKLPLRQSSEGAKSQRPSKASSFVADSLLNESPDRLLILGALDRTKDAYLMMTPAQHGKGPSVLYVNPAFCDLTGYTRAEIDTDGARILRQMKLDQYFEQQRLESLGTDLTFKELLCRHKDGTDFWAELQLIPVQTGTDWSTYWVGILRDVSQRKATEKALLESQLRLNGILNTLSDVVWSMDLAQTTFIYLSPTTDKILGYTVEELYESPSTWRAMIDPRDLARVQSVFDQAIPNGGFSVDYRIILPDGQERWLRNKAHVICDTQGQPHHLDGIANDITCHKEADERMERMANFTQFNPNPIYELNEEGKLTYFNEAASTLAVSLGGIKPIDILPAETKQIVADCLASGKPRLRLELGYGDRTISWSYFPIPATRIIHCYAGDITDRIRLEAQLRQSEKLKSVGQLAGGVAHDFNNILTIIQGFSNLLISRDDLAEEAQDQLQQIAAATNKASDLTKQLLLFSRRQVLQAKTFNLGQVVSDLAKMLKRLLGEDVLLLVEDSSAGANINADQGMIEQIIVNLASNARDAMPRGGSLTLKTEVIEIGVEHLLKTPEARSGRYACLSAIDSGSGMDSATMQHIFEPFFTTKLPGKGTGLGLSTVYGIARQHEGWVQVESTIGKGTTFRVFLPLTLQETQRVEQLSVENKSKGGHETILVVEDEVQLRALLRCILQSNGYTVIEAKHGLEALRKWDQHRDEIDLLLTDLVMPGTINGIDLAERLQSDKESLKVILSSGYSADVVGEKMAFDPGTNFLAKPYMPAELLRLVRSCLDGPSGVSAFHASLG